MKKNKTDTFSFGSDSCTVNYNNTLCFEKLTDEEIKLLEKNTVEISYKKGDIICKQGAFASHVMFLCKGLVKSYVENKNNTLLLRIIPAGNIIGLSSLLEGNTTFPFSLATYTDSKIRMFDINIFREIIKKNPSFAYEIINVFCENTIQIYGRFFAMVHKQSYGRLADLLLCLSSRVFSTDTFELQLSRKELAELSGLSRENVIRILKKFENDKLIKLDGKVVKILDPEGLQKISDHG